MFPNELVANRPGVDTQIFSNGTLGWLTWHKPVGRSFAYILVIGSGGGGGGGGAVNTTGGGGGSSGGTSTLLVPLDLLPDTLYIQPGLGGPGGASATGASPGVISYVGTAPYSGSNKTQLLTYAPAGAAGGGGGASAGTAGAAPTIGNVAAAILAMLGVASWNVGFAGIVGGSAAPGGNVTIAGMTTGGAGGAGSAGAGGNINTLGFQPTIVGGSGGASPTAGESGLWQMGQGTGWLFTGGAGGGGTSTNSTTGGAGGNGGPGCGGGGGGCGSGTSGVGGAGGRGGDGLVAIFCF